MSLSILLFFILLTLGFLTHHYSTTRLFNVYPVERTALTSPILLPLHCNHTDHPLPPVSCRRCSRRQCSAAPPGRLSRWGEWCGRPAGESGAEVSEGCCETSRVIAATRGLSRSLKMVVRGRLVSHAHSWLQRKSPERHCFNNLLSISCKSIEVSESSSKCV